MRRMRCIERSRVIEGVRDPQILVDLDHRGLFLQTRYASLKTTRLIIPVV